MRILLVVAFEIGCGMSSTCPDNGVVYKTSCAPLPAGSAGCQGGPMNDHPDVVYPVGCTTLVPTCDPFYPGEDAMMECVESAAAPHWMILTG